MNGVTHSILRVLDHLQERGDDVLVIAPSAHDGGAENHVKGAEIHRLPAVPLAGYTNVRVAMGGVYRVKRILADYAPDVVHLASPFVLGWRAAQAAAQLGIPTVAVYQTEVPGYAARYGVPFLENWAWNRVENIHVRAEPVARTRHTQGADVAPWCGHRKVLAGKARRRVAGFGGPGRPPDHRLRGQAGSGKAGGGPRRPGRNAGHHPGDRW